MDNRSNQILYTPTQKSVPAVADLSSFYQPYSEKDSFDTGASGNYTLNLSATPSGTIRVVTVVMGRNFHTTLDRIGIRVIINGDIMIVTNELNVANSKSVNFFGHLFLDESDYVEVKFIGCSAGDNISMYGLGYDIKKY